jgi:type II secretory ATPase GspE/PulE/Tfp pilus assembly ATPase PilB-like protein
MAGMDIANQRRPGEGRWLYEQSGKRLDLRVSCMATLFGEDMSLRIWDRDAGFRQLHELGLTPGDLDKVTSLLSRPSGLILVTGPTGAGKTTTLYSCLQYLNNGERKINTLEDPIEYALEGIRQSQVRPKIGVDFPELLRNVLRQAPDVIMIGEVRDEETAVAAVRAANSGHLVLATLHAPVAASAVQSMLVLGSQPFFLSACLLGVIAQRLIRTLCPECRMCFDLSEAPQTFAEIKDLLEPDEGQAIYGPVGCEKCHHVGYAARTGLFEIMTLNQEIRKLLGESRPAEDIEEAAIRYGMIEFRRGALLKVAQGTTSTEEILRDVPAEFLGLED